MRLNSCEFQRWVKFAKAADPPLLKVFALKKSFEYLVKEKNDKM